MRTKINITGSQQGNNALYNALPTAGAQVTQSDNFNFIIEYKTKREAQQALIQALFSLREQDPETDYLRLNTRKTILWYDTSLASIPIR